ncbi:MAG: BMP family ABC transporter substrate-binding protein [Defluviitaleaceae bacterium]|nr:BMP family ABC transporter substrate-binding protein [Defluviitaleaceae bacterium]
MKKFLKGAIVLALGLAFLAGCSRTEEETTTPVTLPAELPATSDFSVAMIADVGGINDQSFNQSAWEGLQQLRPYGHTVNFLEATNASDYIPHISQFVDQDKDLIWGVGFRMGDAIADSARINPDHNFAIVDFSYGDDTLPNVTGVMFKAQEPSFLVGFMAGMETESNIVGFIGGIRGNIIDQFEFGFRAGVEYAARERGVNIEVLVEYADSFADVAAGRAIATVMYTNGADIVFHAAGSVGLGVIEAAVDHDRRVIGVDQDQSHLAPNNVMSSALKLVGEAMYDISLRLAAGENIGGQTLTYGIAEGGVGIPPRTPGSSTALLVSEANFNRTMEIQERILTGDIVVPENEAGFNAFVAGL